MPPHDTPLALLLPQLAKLKQEQNELERPVRKLTAKMKSITAAKQTYTPPPVARSFHPPRYWAHLTFHSIGTGWQS